MAIEMTIEQLKKEFDANDGVISAIKCEGFTKFTCRISGASWAVIKTAKGFQIIAEFIRGAAFSYSKVYQILKVLKMARKFRLQLTNEREPILIVADTDKDAMAQMKELKRHTKANVVSFFEVFDMPPKFNRQFNNIFA